MSGTSSPELNALLTASEAQTAALIEWGIALEARVTALEGGKPVPPENDDFTDPALWNRTFTSDFSKGPLDPAIWKNYFYFGDRVLNSNGERQYYMNQGYEGDGKYNNPDGTHNLDIDPFTFDASGLHIEAAVSDPAKSPHYWGYPYTSGLLTTEDSFDQVCGRFVIKCKLPAGKGLWPAFWLLPKDKSWPPEIDVFEAFGAPSPSGEGGPPKIHVGIHAVDTSKNAGDWFAAGDITGSYNVYAAEWDATHITFFFNDKQLVQYPTPPEFTKPMYLLANLAVGGTWPGLPDATTKFPCFMDVEFIRAYARK